MYSTALLRETESIGYIEIERGRESERERQRFITGSVIKEVDVPSGEAGEPVVSFGPSPKALISEARRWVLLLKQGNCWPILCFWFYSCPLDGMTFSSIGKGDPYY